MDQEMEEPLNGDFLSLEIDLDYEFDAARFFDFSRQESVAEAWEAELWFETAGSYPPSHFIGRLNIGKDVLVESVNTLSKFKDAEDSSCIAGCSNTATDPEFSSLNESCEGWADSSSKVVDIPREEKKFIKGPFSKGSTLLKPTASHIAKQTRLREVKHTYVLRRFPEPLLQKCERRIQGSSENGGHAAKRQKLEGGLLHKVVGVKEQTDLLHKAPQKKAGTLDFNSHIPRLRITIPREPELETAQRAQRLRSNNVKQPQEGKISATQIFKARRLNRKILEAPSLPLPQKSTPRLPQFQPFHLKTEERALQHSSIRTKSSVAKQHISISTTETGAPGLRKLQCQIFSTSHLQNDETMPDDCSAQPGFKARPLDKKILSSKGDIGVFRSTKRETTTPIEFNFATNKKCQQDPPTELFNKLSLNSEAQSTSASQTRFLWPVRGATKGWKENIDCTVQQGHKEIRVEKGEIPRHEIKHGGSGGLSFSSCISQSNKLSNSSCIR